MNKNTIFYILVIGIFGFLLLYIFEQGQLLEIGKNISKSHPTAVSSSKTISLQDTMTTFIENIHFPFARLLLQIIIIIIVTRFFGWIMMRIGQSSVIGEIIAGIVLGPSLVGVFFPEIYHFLFPPESMKNLQFLSQIGLILFMFIVGMETEFNIMKKKAFEAMVISNTSIIFPFFLGVCLAYYLYNGYAPANTSFLAFSIFMGIAMSITAFPVLARIIQERGMIKTTLGSLILTYAAANDVTAWCLLAVVIAIVKAGAITGALFTIALSIIYIFFMLFIIKPLLNKVAEHYYTRETISKAIVTIMIAVLLFSSYLTELIGIHALFGAFLAGVIVPTKSRFRVILSGKIEDISIVLLLPLFFVFMGLRTQIGLLNEPHLWVVFLLVVGVAVAGKFLGSALAARFVGHPWNESVIIGALMNTRGLMELIVLNIGYELGILSPEIFTIMVLMAIITTFMTTPALDITNYFVRKKSEKAAAKESLGDFNVLVSFGAPQTGCRLLELVQQLNLKNSHNIHIHALHLTPRTDISIEEAKYYEQEGFHDVMETAQSMKLDIVQHYHTTNDVSKEIISFANQSKFDLMLVGTARTPFSTLETGGKVKYFFEDAKCPVGVLIDKDFARIEKILIIINEYSDNFLTKYGKKFLNKSTKRVAVLDNNRLLENDESYWGMSNEHNHHHITRIEDTILNKSFMHRFDLILMSLNCWNQVKQENLEWLKYSPSILIINNK